MFLYAEVLQCLDHMDQKKYPFHKSPILHKTLKILQETKNNHFVQGMNMHLLHTTMV